MTLLTISFLAISLLYQKPVLHAKASYESTKTVRRVLTSHVKKEEQYKNSEKKTAVSQVSALSIGEKKEIATPTPKKAWGQSVQIDEHTWTITVGKDDKTATAGEILSALNSYRAKHGVSVLSKDDRLQSYAQERANTFASAKELDSHAGFRDFIKNQNGFVKVGFNSLGENSSYGYTLEAVHLIEWVYAGDKPHDDNQLRSSWTHVGIGVNSTATDLIFGGAKQ